MLELQLAIERASPFPEKSTDKEPAREEEEELSAEIKNETHAHRRPIPGTPATRGGEEKGTRRAERREHTNPPLSDFISPTHHPIAFTKTKHMLKQQPLTAPANGAARTYYYYD